MKLDLSKKSLSKMMDYAQLAASTSKEKIIEGCKTSIEYGFAGFHTMHYWSELVASELEGTGIETGWNIAFPLGADFTEEKAAEVRRGAKIMRGRPWCVDAVTLVGALKSKDYDAYREDMRVIAQITHDNGGNCKAILEVPQLTDEEIKIACELAAEAGMDWVKSATGFGGWPTLDQLRLMRKYTPEHIKIKYAGSMEYWYPTVTLGAMIAGCERIGTSRAPKLVDELSTLTRDELLGIEFV